MRFLCRLRNSPMTRCVLCVAHVMMLSHVRFIGVSMPKEILSSWTEKIFHNKVPVDRGDRVCGTTIVWSGGGKNESLKNSNFGGGSHRKKVFRLWNKKSNPNPNSSQAYPQAKSFFFIDTYWFSIPIFLCVRGRERERLFYAFSLLKKIPFHDVHV